MFLLFGKPENLSSKGKVLETDMNRRERAWKKRRRRRRSVRKRVAMKTFSIDFPQEAERKLKPQIYNNKNVRADQAARISKKFIYAIESSQQHIFVVLLSKKERFEALDCLRSYLSHEDNEQQLSVVAL